MQLQRHVPRGASCVQRDAIGIIRCVIMRSSLHSLSMEQVVELPEKLGLVLKALSLSRVALAQRLGVDKSLVGRWLSGAVHPTEHNLARLAALVAETIPAFRLADLYGGIGELASRLGVAVPKRTSDFRMPELLASFLEFSRSELEHRGKVYEGFWRSTRPSLIEGTRLFHEYGIIHRNDDGLLEVIMAGSGLEFSGWAFPSNGNLFVFLFDNTGRTPVFALFRGVSVHKAMTLDGMLTLAALDPERTPVVLPAVIERVEDIVGDYEADLARFRAMMRETPKPLEPVNSAVLDQRMYRDVGPQSALSGGESFLSVSGLNSLSRGILTAD